MRESTITITAVGSLLVDYINNMDKQRYSLSKKKLPGAKVGQRWYIKTDGLRVLSSKLIR